MVKKSVKYGKQSHDYVVKSQNNERKIIIMREKVEIIKQKFKIM